MRLIRLAVAALVLLYCGQALAVSPSLDATGYIKTSFDSASSGSISVTTTSTNDIVLLFVQGTRRTSPSAAITSVTTSGLTWTNRSAKQNTYGPGGCFGGGNTCYGDLEVWCAFSSGTLSSASTTVHWDRSVDETALVAVGVTNAGTSCASAFDSNGALPAYNQNLTASTVTLSSTVSTSQSADLIFAAMGRADQFNGTIATCSGWSQTYIVDSSGPSDYATLWVTSKAVSSLQSSLSVPFFTSSCTANPAAPMWTTVGDALTNPNAPATPNSLMMKGGPW